MNSFLVIRPPETYNNDTITCIKIDNNVINTLEKYRRTYTFKKKEQICYSSPCLYDKTLQVHIEAFLKHRTETSLSKNIVTIVGFGASGSGKTFNLLGVDSSGLRNKYSILCGIIGDICKTTITNTTIEVTQVYKNQMFVIQPAQKITIDKVYDVFRESLIGWKQQQFSTHNSSRAHLIVKLTFPGLEIRIIDTAGFERPDNEREHAETVAINRDMLAFKECIMAFSHKHKYIPSRRRTITRILFDRINDKQFCHHIFTFGTIDPNHDIIDTKQELDISNTKHPKIGVVSNTLNYLTMLGCAKVITTRRPISSHSNNFRQKSKSNDEENNTHDNSLILPKLDDRTHTKPSGGTSNKSLYKVNRRRMLTGSSHINLENQLITSGPEVEIKQHCDVMTNDHEILDSQIIIQNITNNRKKQLPTTITRYIKNQTILMNRMNIIDYEKDKLGFLNLINDQQLLTITMQMVVLNCCEMK